MSLIEDFVLRIKRGEGPVYGTIRRTAKGLLRSNLPVPSVLKPVLRSIYHLHFSIWYVGRWLLNYFYREPLFRSRCTTVGRNLTLTLLPDISGHAEIHIGDDVSLTGHFAVVSGRLFDRPRLVLHDRVGIGHNVFFGVNKEIVVEEDARIATGCRLADSDGHPKNADLRAQNLPPDPDEVKPIRICRKAWIGHGSYVMKGVTVGEGAIIGANSVVITDIPPYCLAMGNPAEVYFRNIGKTRTKPATAAPAESVQAVQRTSIAPQE